MGGSKICGNKLTVAAMSLMNGHDPLLGQSGLSGHHHHRSDLMGPGRHNGGHLLGGGDDEEEEEEEDDDDDEHRHEVDGIGDMQDRFEDEWSKGWACSCIYMVSFRASFDQC